MEKKDKIIYCLLAVVLVLFAFIFFRGEKLNTQVENYKKEVELLKTTEKVLRTKIDSVSSQINNTKTVINNITKEKEIQIRYVKELKDSQLQTWFNQRYGEK